MKESILNASSWYNAVNLSERIASLCTDQQKVLNATFDINGAKTRLNLWKSQNPFSTDLYVDQRLSMEGISEEDFLFLLGESSDSVQARFKEPPDWLNGIAEAYFRPEPTEPMAIQELTPGHETVGFLGAIEPLIRQGREHVQLEVQKLASTERGLPFDPKTVVNLLYANLPWRLLLIMSRTMVLELNVARLKNLLEGETPKERFISFMRLIRCRDFILSLFQEYPVLARELSARIDQWTRFSLEYLHHLCSDWGHLKSNFSQVTEPGAMIELNASMGNTHRDGRSVMTMKFASGLQLVYKPHSLAIDVHFQELLSWINQLDNSLPFRTINVLNRGSYGWIEFVNHIACESEEEVRHFYERQGKYLALFFALEATDYHFENLIASGEHPVPVDLESLFHPREEEKGAENSEIANNILWHSVARVGLLPQRIWADLDYEDIDLSGLGFEGGQFTPDKLLQLEGIFTDEIRYIRKRSEMPKDHHCPTLNGKKVDVLNYADAIYDGFSKMYRFLMYHSYELLSDEGLLTRFAQDEVRMIARATRAYGKLLHESHHPDFLRNALDRDIYLDRIWKGVKERPQLARLIPYELKDIHRGEIPLFSTRPDSCNLWSSMGECIHDYFEESSMSLVRRRINGFNEMDLNKQLWFIRAMLASLAMGKEGMKKPPNPLVEIVEIPDRNQLIGRLLAGARAAGCHLEMLALRNQDDITWLGLSMTGERRWLLAPMGFDLYSGLAGMALFLGYLGAVTEEEHFLDSAKAALVGMCRQIELRKISVKLIGAFDGWGGVIYALTHLGVLLNKPSLLFEAEGLVKHINDLVMHDEAFDIISGSAGCIGSLLCLHRCEPSDEILAVAVKCGDHLIAKAQPMRRGIGWLTNISIKNPLTGFSHGAAGIAWALLELFAVTQEERFKNAAILAMEYEQDVFIPEQGNWPDYRTQKEKGEVLWCHGAPGIGLARLRSLKHLDCPIVRAEISIALKTTLERGFSRNLSICHGDLGNLEFLLQAGEILCDSNLKNEVDRLSSMILDTIERNGWYCGVPLGTETPGLMCGIAGIGYELLRLVEPKKVPSVLVLEPPKFDSRSLKKGKEILFK